MRYALLLLLLAPVPALGAVPNPANSIISCIRACPGGDVGTTIIVRDLADNPVPNAFVEVKLDAAASPCNTASLCVPTDGGTTDYDFDPLTFRRAFKFTDAAGEVTFHLRVIGECEEAADMIRVVADGVVLGDRPLASLDAAEDWVVDLNDLDLHATRLGTEDPRSNFVCDGGIVITQDDLDFIPLHGNHTCTVPLPIRESTWGSLKQIYR
jgi:hypothetical protein